MSANGKKLVNPLTNRRVTPSRKNANSIAAALPKLDIPQEWQSVIQEYEAQSSSINAKEKTSKPMTVHQLYNKKEWVQDDYQQLINVMKSMSSADFYQYPGLMSKLFSTCDDIHVFKAIFHLNKSVVDALKLKSQYEPAIILLARDGNRIDLLDTVLEAQSRFNDFSAWSKVYNDTTPFVEVLKNGNMKYCELITKYLSTPDALKNLSRDAILTNVLIANATAKNEKVVSFFLERYGNQAVKDDIESMLHKRFGNTFHLVSSVAQFETLEKILGEVKTKQCLLHVNEKNRTPFMEYMWRKNKDLTAFVAGKYTDFFWDNIPTYDVTFMIHTLWLDNDNGDFYTFLGALCDQYDKKKLFLDLLTLRHPKNYYMSALDRLMLAYNPRKQELVRVMNLVFKRMGYINVQYIRRSFETHCKEDNYGNYAHVIETADTLAPVVEVIVRHTNVTTTDIINAKICTPLKEVLEQTQKEQKEQFDKKLLASMQKFSKVPHMTNDIIYKILSDAVPPMIKEFYPPKTLKGYISKYQHMADKNEFDKKLLAAVQKFSIVPQMTDDLKLKILLEAVPPNFRKIYTEERLKNYIRKVSAHDKHTTSPSRTKP